MAEITCLGYYILGAKDLQAWATFAEDILGLRIAHQDDEYLTLRMDEYVHRVVLEKSDLDDFAGAGWMLDNAVLLEEFVRQLAAKGVEVKDGGEELAQKRGVSKVYYTEDLNGFRHEFYHGLELAPFTEPFRSKVVSHAGFVTGRLGIGHFVPIVKDYKATVDYFVNVLGLRISDYIRAEVSPGFINEATFLYTHTGRHHSIATMHIPNFPKRIRHIMFQVNDLFDLGRAYERTQKAGLLAQTLGQHTNDRTLSFYIWSPSGYQIEYGWGGIIVDDATWNTKIHTAPSVWGHKHTGKNFGDI